MQILFLFLLLADYLAALSTSFEGGQLAYSGIDLNGRLDCNNVTGGTVDSGDKSGSEIIGNSDIFSGIQSVHMAEERNEKLRLGSS
jgi:hypothetical protein